MKDSEKSAYSLLDVKNCNVTLKVKRLYIMGMGISDRCLFPLSDISKFLPLSHSGIPKTACQQISKSKKIKMNIRTNLGMNMK